VSVNKVTKILSYCVNDIFIAADIKINKKTKRKRKTATKNTTLCTNMTLSRCHVFEKIHVFFLRKMKKPLLTCSETLHTEICLMHFSLNSHFNHIQCAICDKSNKNTT